MSKPRATTKPSRRAPAGGAIPSFGLYGEASAPQQETLHVEEIQSRSRLYQWEIKPHVHQGLYQIVWLHRGRADVGIDEWSGVVEGPAAIVAPPGVVHGFRFAPEVDGLVLTLSARFLVEGELRAATEAFRTLFLAPAVSPAFSCWSRSIFSTAGRSSAMPAPSACRTRASTGSRGRRLEARRSKSSMSA